MSVAGESAGTGARPGHTSGLEELARDWARAVTQAVYRPLSRSEAEDLLAALLAELRDALLAHPFAAEPARSVGARLAAGGIRRPQALERSLIFLDEHLLTELDLDDYVYRPLMTRLLAGLAGGWAAIVREEASREARKQGRPQSRSRRAEPSVQVSQRGA